MPEDAVAAGLGRRGVLAPGTVIGPYRVERQIGDEDVIERFLVEARSAARLDYPSVVSRPIALVS